MCQNFLHSHRLPAPVFENNPYAWMNRAKIQRLDTLHPKLSLKNLQIIRFQNTCYSFLLRAAPSLVESTPIVTMELVLGKKDCIH